MILLERLLKLRSSAILVLESEVLTQGKVTIPKIKDMTDSSLAPG